ncbi:MAG: hypothetical protein ACYTGG_08050 [Planctomycetota bacterium]|jgi:hypothetical protein
MIRHLRSGRFAAAVLLCLLLGSCDETDLTSIRLTVAADGSGTIRMSTVAEPASAPVTEADSTGATWGQHVSVAASVGRFDDVTALRIADLQFHLEVNTRGMVMLEVIVPLGRDARWIRQLSPLTEAQRTGTARAFDPSGRTRSLGAYVKLEIEVPEDVVASELDTYVQAISPARDDRTATLIVPVDGGADRPDHVSWLITWRQP